MVQFNLLPSVKVEYIRARRQKRLVTLACFTVSIASIAVVLLLSSVVFVGQNLRLKSLDKTIKADAAELKAKPDINKVLTIQNQLKAIDQLHDEKPEAGRVFGYLQKVTPSKITIETLTVDFIEPTMTFTGQAPSLEEVNKFVDSLKFTTITREGDETTPKAFSQVVLTAFGRDAKGASFSIELNYDPTIFSSQETALQLTVPAITSTRSETERPTDLFKENQTPLEEKN